jgi:hypothetical protein
MSTINIKLYDFARVKLKLSENDAKEFLQVVDEVLIEERNQTSIAYKSLFKEDFIAMDKKLSIIELKIAESKNDMLKWFFGFFIALALMIVGTYFKK